MANKTPVLIAKENGVLGRDSVRWEREQRIMAVLLSNGGRIDSPEGTAIKDLTDALVVYSKQTVSWSLGQMIKKGMITKDVVLFGEGPLPSRCYSITLVDGNFPEQKFLDELNVSAEIPVVDPTQDIATNLLDQVLNLIKNPPTVEVVVEKVIERVKPIKVIDDTKVMELQEQVRVLTDRLIAADNTIKEKEKKIVSLVNSLGTRSGGLTQKLKDCLEPGQWSTLVSAGK